MRIENRIKTRKNRCTSNVAQPSSQLFIFRLTSLSAIAIPSSVASIISRTADGIADGETTKDGEHAIRRKKNNGISHHNYFDEISR